MFLEKEQINNITSALQISTRAPLHIEIPRAPRSANVEQQMEVLNKLARAFQFLDKALPCPGHFRRTVGIEEKDPPSVRFYCERVEYPFWIVYFRSDGEVFGCFAIPPSVVSIPIRYLASSWEDGLEMLLAFLRSEAESDLRIALQNLKDLYDLSITYEP